MNQGKHLAKKLKSLGVKKMKFAELLGVHPNTVTAWLAKPELSPAVQLRVAEALGLSVSALFSPATYDEPGLNAPLVSEPESAYGLQQLGAKKLNAHQYCGKLKLSDGLSLQHKWRSEW